MSYEFLGDRTDPYLKRLIYLSAAAGLDPGRDLARILDVSRHNNIALGVTGILMYHDGTFLQILEGDELSVQKLYARISLDDRHRGLQKLPEHNVDARLFPDWTMAFARPETVMQEPDLGVRAFKAVRQDLDRIERLDRRAAIFARTFFASFRDIGSPTGG